MQSWNSYLPLVMLSSDDLYPGARHHGLSGRVLVNEPDYNTIALHILQPGLLFLLAQKHIVAGLTAGAGQG